MRTSYRYLIAVSALRRARYLWRSDGLIRFDNILKFASFAGVAPRRRSHGPRLIYDEANV